MTYVTDQTSAELCAHMRKLKTMHGWHEPLADRLWKEVQDLISERDALRAALQDKAGEVTVAIDSLYNERRDGMTNVIFPPVQIGTKLFAAHPAPVVPDGHPLMIFAKECELGAYMEHEVPMAARKAIAASQQKGGQ